jgi:hypothetical protein
MKLRCFVVIPFKETFDRVYEAILRSADTLSPAVEVEFTRADRDRIDWNASTNVKKHIDMCDFAIADVSEHNPNVFYEIGYLQAMGKPTVLLTRSTPPAQAWQLPYAIYSEDRLEDLPGALRPLLSGVHRELAEHRASKLTKTVAYRSTPGDEILSALRTATRDVDILATHLEGAFSVGIVDEIIRLLDRTMVRLRVLALNPESFIVSARASQLGLTATQYRGTAAQSLAQSAELTLRFPDRCEIRLYDEPPYQAIYRIDNVVFVALLTSHRSSRDSAVIKFSLAGDSIATEMMNQFELVWARATPLKEGANPR